MDVIANGGDAHADPVFVRVPHGNTRVATRGGAERFDHHDVTLEGGFVSRAE